MSQAGWESVCYLVLERGQSHFFFPCPGHQSASAQRAADARRLPGFVLLHPQVPPRRPVLRPEFVGYGLCIFTQLVGLAGERRVSSIIIIMLSILLLCFTQTKTKKISCQNLITGFAKISRMFLTLHYAVVFNDKESPGSWTLSFTLQ